MAGLNEKHVLKTSDDCDCFDPYGGVGCPVCDGGLGVCKHCGAAESELDDWPTCEAYRNRLNEAEPIPAPEAEPKLPPAPWRVSEDASGDLFVSAADSSYVAEVGYIGDLGEGSLVALILAAAPELLDALDDLDRYSTTVPGYSGSPTEEKVSAALAKARGEN